MKNLTHYFQSSKSPPGAAAIELDSSVVEDAAHSKSLNGNNASNEKESTSKKDGLNLKSKKSLSRKKKEKCDSKNSSADSSVEVVESPLESQLCCETEKKQKGDDESLSNVNTETSEITSKNEDKSFASNMQQILQKVMKQKFPISPNSPKMHSNTDDAKVEESESTPGPLKKKKRGRKSLKELSKTEEENIKSGRKLSYEELEMELKKERMLIAKLKESFLSSNPAADLVAKYDKTLTPGRSILKPERHSKSRRSESCTPTDMESKSTSKVSELNCESESNKSTPKNNTKLMKEVLDYLDQNESKIEKSGNSKSKSSKSKSKLNSSTDVLRTDSKIKKKLNYADELAGKELESINKKEEVNINLLKEKILKQVKEKVSVAVKGSLKVGEKEDLEDSPSSQQKKKPKKGKQNLTEDNPEELFAPNSVSPERKKRKYTRRKTIETAEDLNAPVKEKKKRKKVSSSDVVEEPMSEKLNKKPGKNKKNVETKKIKKENDKKKTIVNSKGEKSGKGINDLDSSSDSVFMESTSRKSKESNSPSKDSVQNIIEDCQDNKVNKLDSTSPLDNQPKNNLLKYFGKVPKSDLKKEEKRNSLTTKAVVHSPPRSPSKKRKSTEPINLPRPKKLKSMLLGCDKIEVLSSESVQNVADSNVESNVENNISVCKVGNTSDHKSKIKSPKKWSMRVKLAIQSPSKLLCPGVSEKSKKAISEEKGSNRDLKRCLFSSKSSPQEPKKVKSSTVSEDSVDSDISAHSEETDSTSLNDQDKKSKMSDPQQQSKPPVKLASIFLKNNSPKTPSSTDEKSLKAKKDFLASGVPDIIKQKTEQLKASEKNDEESYFVPFPKVNHVGYNTVRTISESFEERLKSLKLKPPSDPLEVVNLCLKKPWNYNIPATPSFNFKSSSWSKCEDMKRQLRLLKKQVKNFPFEAFEKKLDLMLKNEKSSREVNQNHELWTEKYKPQNSSEVLGNGTCISELKSWLEKHKVSKKKLEDSNFDDSCDNFISSDDDSSLEPLASNIAVVVGPSGCGKTSSIYAVTKELGCKVLELNASCNRNGKKVLGELLEATQSHQVKQVSNALTEMITKTSKHKVKKKRKKDLKVKEAEKQDIDSKVMSVILIEDADLIFSDFDDGFTNALFSLSTMSKRPIILVVNSLQSPHISKFVKQNCLLLKFSKPSPIYSSVWLQLIAAKEAVELPAHVAKKILSEANEDVRQSMLNLQFHILSSSMPQVSIDFDWPLNVSKLWWQWPSIFSKTSLTMSFIGKLQSVPPTDSVKLVTERNEGICRDNSEKKFPNPESCSKIHKLASFIDSLASIETWMSSSHQCSNPSDSSPESWRISVSDSCSLNERTNLEHFGYEAQTLTLSHDVISNHYQQLGLGLMDSSHIGFSPDLAKWKRKLNILEDLLLMSLPMSEQIHREATACDYLPLIRCINRSECLRLAGNSKRSNRFFNYLSSLNIHPNESQINLMCNAFASASEKDEKPQTGVCNDADS